MALKNTYQARKRFTKTPVKSTGMWYQDGDVVVPSNQITMKGPQGQPNYFNSPILGVGMQSGETQVMQPGREYLFPNDQSVYERKMQNGAINLTEDIRALKPKEDTFGKVLNYADLATDVMQAGHFIPHPIGQAVGYVGDFAGAGVDALQSIRNVSQGNYTDAAINAGLALLPLGAGKQGYKRANSLISGKGSGYYRPLQALPHLKNNPVVKKGIGWNRATLGANALEVGSNIDFNNDRSSNFGGYQDNTRVAPSVRPEQLWYTPQMWDNSVSRAKKNNQMQNGGLFPVGPSVGVDPEMMFRNKYNTQLKSKEQKQFDSWADKESKRQGRDILMDMGAYDVTGFWKSGDYKRMDSDNHGSDKWKKPNHPTFSNQSKYHGADGWYGGNWTDKAGYQPSKQTLETYGPDYYNEMFQSEPGRSEYLDLSRYESGQNKPTPFIYQIGGDITDLDTMKNAYGYTKKYYNSPKFKERFINANLDSYGYGPTMNKIIDEEYNSTLSKINNNLNSGSYYLLQGERHQPIFDALIREYKGRPNPEREGIGSHFDSRTNTTFVYKDEKNDNNEKFGVSYIAPHEFSHQAISGINTMPLKQREEIKNMQLRKNLHLNNPNETKADIDAFRYYLYKNNIYNPMTEDFTQEHLEKYKKIDNKAYKRLNELYLDSDLIKLMNTVAKDYNINNNKNYVKYGGQIKSYQEGGEKSTEQNPTRMAPINISAKRRNQDYRTYQDNTINNNQIVPLEARGRRYIQPTLSEYVEPSIGDRILSTLASPMTALSNNRTGSRNPYDYALDMVNPFSWIQSGERAVGSLAQGQYTDAALNALGAIPAIGFADDAARFASKAGRYATTQTPLKNTYKINPWAFEPNPKAYYHRSPDFNNVVNRETGMLQGFGESEAGKLFSEATSRNSGIGINLKKPANSRLYFAKGTPLDYGRTNKVIDPKTGKLISGQGYPGPYMIEVDGVPMGVSTKGRAPGNAPTRIGDYAVSKRPVSLDEAKFYKEDWLRGYKEIDEPKSNFKSEIDWGKWNPDTPKYPELIDEYNTIEKSTKQSGTWMKNPDGSSFQGTPEQFVQQQSSWFKKAFGNSKLLNDDGSPMFLYHGSAKKFDTFDPSKFQLGDAGYSGKGIYTTPSKTLADSYAFSSGKNHTGTKTPTTYQLYGQANNPIRSSELPEGDDLFNFYREKDFAGNVPIEKQLRNYDAAIANKRGMIDRVYPDKDAAEIVFPTNRQLKSAVGNVGFFDMTNPNIYKAIAPIGAGLGVGASQLQEKKYGGLQQSYKKTKRFK